MRISVASAALLSAALFQDYSAFAGRLGDDDVVVQQRKSTSSRKTGFRLSEGMNHSTHNMLYYNTKMMDKVRQKIQEMLFKDGKLNLPIEMLKSLDFGKGEKCTSWADYTTDDMGDKEWQCANTNWIYDPPAAIRDKMLHFVGDITETETKPELNAEGSGLWCGMNMESDQDSESARIYWANCGSPGGGYFNALRCKDKTVYAVIGIKAANPGICYPAHASTAEEAFWQVAGQATWRRFNDGGKEEEDPHGDHAGHFYPHGVVHEFETDDDIEYEGMLSIYFWGMQSTSNLQAVQHHRRAELEGKSCWYRYCEECGVPSDGWPSCPAGGRDGRRGRRPRFKHSDDARHHGPGGGRSRRGDDGYDDDYDDDRPHRRHRRPVVPGPGPGVVLQPAAVPAAPVVQAAAPLVQAAAPVVIGGRAVPVVGR